MTRSLLALSIGPVQDFIAAARRTRDLWFGSYLLSEISKAAARAVKDAGGNLVFPHPGGDLERDGELNVANVILAEVEDTPRDLCTKAEEAARAEWKRCADDARNRAERQGLALRKDLWDRQVDDVIEIYAAWTPISHGPGGYKAARRRVMRLLGARKNCRDFLPAWGAAGVPKSSLDGLRESVLPEKEKRGRGWAIKDGEQLCAVGLTKRLSGGRTAFPSVSRIAADPWIRGVLQEDARALEDFLQVCRELEHCGALSRVPTSQKSQGGNSSYAVFPFEGSVLFASRMDDLADQAQGLDPGGEAVALVQKARELLARLCKRYGEPFPYLAVLVADGDRMGKAIDLIGDPERHREFSQELSRFAGDAHDIVCDFGGVCVYSGGDDVLAFLPCDQVIPCARNLHESFGNLMGSFLDEESRPPTLSVGVAVGHLFEDLEDLLAFGREAERLAKEGRSLEDDRNGLAVVVRSRGGDKCVVREQWGEQSNRMGIPDSLDQRLLYWGGRFAEGALPNKFPYELRSTAAFYEGWANQTQRSEAMGRDTARILERKDVTLRPDDKNILREWLVARAESEGGMGSVADEWIIGQWLGYALAQAKGGKGAC